MAKKRSHKRHYKKRKKINIKALLILLAALAAAACIIMVLAFFVPRLTGTVGTRYIAGTTASVNLYYYDDYDKHLLKSADTIARGTEVEYSGETYTQNGQTYAIIEYNEEEYYIAESALVKEADEIVQETEKWVRTSVTVYVNNEDSQIAGFIKKGEQINITGYDEIFEDGSVNMYEVEYNGVTGWVYSKYLVETQEEAEAVYEEVYANHEGREYGYELYGGSVDDVDWYPYEKVSFEDNELLDENAAVMYLNAAALSDIDDYLLLAARYGVNAVVVDIKDDVLTTTFEIAEELTPTSNAQAYMTQEEFAAAIEKIKEAGLYIIARIVVFSDPGYAEDNPDDCIDTTVTTTSWVSAYSRNVWYYNVALAEEVIETYGVNEIQFDYVRFPETAYRMSLDEDTDFKNTYDESKIEALQNFLFYACDRIHEHNVYVSVTLNSEAVGKYVTAYGQYWPAFSNIVDVISPQAFTDYIGGTSDYWSDPYTTVYNWAERAVVRQSEIETPAVVRAWVTGYDVPYWSAYIECDSDYVQQQVQALYDWDLTGGFMVWNSESNLTMYEQIAPAWKTEY